ncbi:cupin domain-containing protein [Prochlorococcus marinus CUG1415]|nr:cupin domain-containing protein [Prochlorococcus marinus CUG1415]
MWIYLRGDPLNLWCLDNENTLKRNLILNFNNPVQMILSGYWQAAKSKGEFTLVSCCVGPGFDFKDFELLSNINYASRLGKAINDLI